MPSRRRRRVYVCSEWVSVPVLRERMRSPDEHVAQRAAIKMLDLVTEARRLGLIGP